MRGTYTLTFIFASVVAFVYLYMRIGGELEFMRNALLRSRSRDSKISQMYYINLDGRRDRNKMMLESVTPLFERKKIPFARVSGAVVTDEVICPARFNWTERRCRGVAGDLESHLKILDELPIVGNTLILEDDYNITSIDAMETAVAHVPEDWEVIRFDCWWTSMEVKSWQHTVCGVPPPDDHGVFRTILVNETEGCWFCGGTHAMLVRASSMEALSRVWPRKPYYDDCDCLLATDKIKSYCVNRGIMVKTAAEKLTDIPKENLP